MKDVVAENGTFSSPSHPNTYSPNTKCMWNITVPTGEVIEISFDSFEVQWFTFIRTVVTNIPLLLKLLHFIAVRGTQKL